MGDICWSGCLSIGQDGQLVLEEGQGLCMWRTVSVGCLVVGRVFSGAFKETMLWCACLVIGAGYCLVVHARLCSAQRILPRSECA